MPGDLPPGSPSALSELPFDLDSHSTLFADQYNSASQTGNHLSVAKTSGQKPCYIAADLLRKQILMKSLGSYQLLRLEQQSAPQIDWPDSYLQNPVLLDWITENHLMKLLIGKQLHHGFHCLFFI